MQSAGPLNQTEEMNARQTAILLAVGIFGLACGSGRPDKTETRPSASQPPESVEPPPLKTVTLDEPEVVALQEEQGRGRRPVGVPCAWGRIWETPGPKPKPVGGLVKPPKKTADVAPVLPYRKTKTQGTPVLEVIITSDGRVSEAKVLQSFDPPWPEGDAAILETVKQWKYEPTRVGGKAIPVCTKITLAVQWTELSRD